MFITVAIASYIAEHGEDVTGQLNQRNLPNLTRISQKLTEKAIKYQASHIGPTYL